MVETIAKIIIGEHTIACIKPTLLNKVSPEPLYITHLYFCGKCTYTTSDKYIVEGLLKCYRRL